MRFATVIVLLIVLLFPILLTGCDEEGPDVGALVTAGIAPIDKRVAALEGLEGDSQKRIKTIEEKYISKDSLPSLTEYSKKSDVPQDFLNNLSEAQLTTLKTRLGITGGSNPGPNPNPNPGSTGGLVSAVIINPPATYNGQYCYTFNPQAIIGFKITNNMGSSRYVRPTITLTTFPAGSSANITNVTCVQSSNSLGQAAPAFNAILSPGSGTVFTIAFTPYAGGVSLGQYLIGSGGSMEVFLTVTLSPSYAGMWAVKVATEDNPL